MASYIAIAVSRSIASTTLCSLADTASFYREFMYKSAKRICWNTLNHSRRFDDKRLSWTFCAFLKQEAPLDSISGNDIFVNASLCSYEADCRCPVTNHAGELLIPASGLYPADYFSGAQINSQAFPDSNLILSFDASLWETSPVECHPCEEPSSFIKDHWKRAFVSRRSRSGNTRVFSRDKSWNNKTPWMSYFIIERRALYAKTFGHTGSRVLALRPYEITREERTLCFRAWQLFL